MAFSRHRGLTIIEILVTLSIVILLVGIALPVINRVREQSRRAVDLSNLRQLVGACITYSQSNDDIYPIGRMSAAAAGADDYTWTNYTNCWSKLQVICPGFSQMTTCASIRDIYDQTNYFGRPGTAGTYAFDVPASLPGSFADALPETPDPAIPVPQRWSDTYATLCDDDKSGGKKDDDGGKKDDDGGKKDDDGGKDRDGGKDDDGHKSHGGGDGGGGSSGGGGTGTTASGPSYPNDTRLGWIYWGGRDDLYVNGKLAYRSPRRRGQHRTPGSATLWTCLSFDSAGVSGNSLCPHVGTKCCQYPLGSALTPPPDGLGVGLDDGSAKFVNWTELVMIQQANGFKLYYQPY